MARDCDWVLIVGVGVVFASMLLIAYAAYHLAF